MQLRGFKTAVEALRLEDYPMDKHDIAYSIGDIQVEDGKGGYFAVRDLLDQISKNDFRSAEDVIHCLREAVHPSREKAA